MKSPQITKRANELRAMGLTKQQVYEVLVWELRRDSRLDEIANTTEDINCEVK